MDRRRFLLTSLAGACAAPLGAGAQQAGKVYRVGVLWGVPEEASKAYRAALEGSLREFGWIEGVNISFTHRSPDSVQRVRELAAQLVAIKPDVIVAATNPVIQELKSATADIPIVMIYALTPVAVGFVRSLRQPGGNVTGLTMDGDPQIAGRYLQALREILPKAKTVVMIYNAAFSKSAGLHVYPQAFEAGARHFGFGLRWLNVNGSADIQNAFQRMAAERADAVIVLSDTVTFAHIELIGRSAVQTRIPSMHDFPEYVIAGGLLSYGVNTLSIPRQAAGHVDKILRGATPANIPVEQATKFDLVINLKTAKALGLTIPPSLLLRADQVIE